MPRLCRAETFRARALRRTSTPAEQALWDLVRGRRLDGAKFRRQQPIGPYIVDFFCVEASLVVEADGAHHELQPAHDHDLARDRWLERLGLTVLRFSNQQILEQPDEVLRRIRARLTSASPLPRGEGRG
jgi:very-short-patch-repair endonuclease